MNLLYLTLTSYLFLKYLTLDLELQLIFCLFKTKMIQVSSFRKIQFFISIFALRLTCFICQDKEVFYTRNYEQMVLFNDGSFIKFKQPVLNYEVKIAPNILASLLKNKALLTRNNFYFILQEVVKSNYEKYDTEIRKRRKITKFIFQNLNNI